MLDNTNLSPIHRELFYRDQTDDYFTTSFQKDIRRYFKCIRTGGICSETPIGLSSVTAGELALLYIRRTYMKRFGFMLVS